MKCKKLIPAHIYEGTMRGRFIELRGTRVRVTRRGEQLAQLLTDYPEMSQRELAARMGISQPAVCQSLRTLRNRAIRTLAQRNVA